MLIVLQKIQLAGAKTAAGNTDNWNATQPWNNLPLTVVMNGNELEPWDIPYVVDAKLYRLLC